MEFLVERFKSKEEMIGESSKNQVNKRNSMEMIDEPESSGKKQKKQTDLNTYFKPFLQIKTFQMKKLWIKKKNLLNRV